MNNNQPRVFQANWPGVCQECSDPIHVGDWIERHIDGYQHTDCRAATKEYTRADACTKCFLVHAGECF